jgi:outer membrane protein insertion porin family
MEIIFKVVRTYIIFLIIFSASWTQVHAAAATKVNPSKNVKVTGFGLFGNHRLKKVLDILDIAQDENQNFIIDTYYIEDAVSVLNDELTGQGYETPLFELKLVDLNGNAQDYFFDSQAGFDPELPLDVTANRLTIHVTPGLLTYYKNIYINGISYLKDYELYNYFYNSDAIILTKKNRPFTRSHLKKSINTLIKRLKQDGYLDAQIEIVNTTKDPKTRGISIFLKPILGPRYHVKHLQLEIYKDKYKAVSDTQSKTKLIPCCRVYSEEWRSDQLNEIRKTYFKKGYPNVEIEVTIEKEKIEAEIIDLSVTFLVHPNEKVKIGTIQWEGAGHTKSFVLNTKQSPKSGDNLDPIAIESEQDRLLGLGAFEGLDVIYDKNQSDLWNINYILKPRKKMVIEALTGWGSYEQLRLGAILSRNNVGGMGHTDSFKLIKSQKSTEGSYNYTIPDFLGKRDLNGTLRSKALSRKELSFKRKEESAAVGVESFLPLYKTSYAFQIKYALLKASEFDGPDPMYRSRAKVSSMELELIKSQLDNPVFPQKGYRISLDAESALSFLGGNTNFYKLETRFSFHRPLTHLWILHTNFRHGVIATRNSARYNLPLNSRFFIGGQNTIRGFREGEASSRNIGGVLIGSETYALFNFELEQKLFSKISLIEFSDTVLIGSRIKNYPGNQTLSSLGGGLLIATVVGPIRFEYGYNIKKRAKDPKATFHFSVGSPF